MEKPKDYRGLLERKLPAGYINATCFSDQERIGIPGPEHPYYVARDKIGRVIRENSALSPEALAEAILEAS